MTQRNSIPPAGADTQAARIADLHRQCRADYDNAAATRATAAGAARDQLALARAHAAERSASR